MFELTRNVLIFLWREGWTDVLNSNLPRHTLYELVELGSFGQNFMPSSRVSSVPQALTNLKYGDSLPTLNQLV